jgi:hypothetical protein
MRTTKDITNSNFISQFWDKKEKILVKIGCFDTIELANEARDKFELEYYTNNTDLLPKGITINTKKTVSPYVLFVRDSKNQKPKYIGCYSNIEKAIEARLAVIKSLLDV